MHTSKEELAVGGREERVWLGIPSMDNKNTKDAWDT